MNTSTVADWFRLTRHDAPADTPPAPDPQVDDDPADGDDAAVDWQAEAGKWKKLSRTNEQRAKDNAAAATRLAELEAAQQTDAERLTQRAADAEARAQAATARAVVAEVKALAGMFADPDDAVALLGSLDGYADAAGDIDTDAIGADLADLLVRKPHLAKPAGPRTPRPDPGVGSRGDAPEVDYRTAAPAVFADELAKYGLRPRS
ncbi:hypothetical protein Lfu02_79920 [Longispora fulva]|uniref:Uncharacterized protein n=1 Tax=Longispora fulva TaxID=619741 RepID=A0A8J7GXI4_9ACTN|nr:hypothetical protein [Longispora fulva]MBG6141125.1 hypothetical protein [Longispora fulva]GIG63620.1 hypothetical protein Lfu02_79920 [Longispora fulva]